MALALAKWSPVGESGVVFDMTAPGAWDALASDYTHPGGNPPLSRVFGIARAHGVSTIVKEPRYVDADWRSQLARFYNGTFRRYPSVCHRLHFFTKPVPSDLVDLSGLQDAYRGYTVLRPLPLAPVGRTMIAPPVELASAVRCEGTELVDIFGWPFTIRSMPFISQDTQFLRCAHAALWMVLRHAAIVHGMPRRLAADVYDAALGGVMVGRQLPSDGLSGFQLLAAMTALGLSPTSKPLPDSPEAEANAGNLRLYAMVCRYVNSRLPPVIISENHAWVIVGYRRGKSAGNSVIELWRHDDARGPYVRVDNPWNEPEDAHRPWLSAYLPLLPKAYLDAERAEAVARSWITQFTGSPAYAGTTLEQADQRASTLERSTLRTYLIESTAFKQQLAGRGVPAQLAAAYRLSPMPRYIWVIEVVDRYRRTIGEPDVLGEIVLDATLTQFEPLNDPAAVMALHIDGFAFVTGVDQSPAVQQNLPTMRIYATGCPPLQ